jgi:glucose-6-phosphate isomerase
VLAQAQALMVGKADAGGHRNFPGNRPSTFLLLDELNPASLGATDRTAGTSRICQRSHLGDQQL